MVDTELPYLVDAGEIYRRSFATIRGEADLARFPRDIEAVVVRMIHGCGQVDLAAQVQYTPDVVHVARTALAAGAPILCDSAMVAAGITRNRLPADNEVVCTLSDQRVPRLAHHLRTTRSAAAVQLWEDQLEGAVVGIGNAPTALFHLLEMVRGGARPAAIFGIPVGFVGAAESKQALTELAGVEYLTVRGRRGGSAITASALNAVANPAE